MASARAPVMRNWQVMAGLFVPVIVSLLAIGVLALGFVMWSAQGVDERALERQMALARHVIARQLQNIPHDQESVTLWDDAVLNTKLSLNTTWVDDNLGLWMRDYFGHDDVIILDHRNQPVYAMLEGERASLDEASRAFVDVAPIAAELRLSIMSGAVDDYLNGRVSRAPRIAELATMNGVPSLVSIAPLISDTGAIVQGRGSEYLHIVAVRLDTDYAHRLAVEYQMPGARFTQRPSGDPEYAAIALSDTRGRFLTFFEWERSSPGQALFYQTIPAIAGAFLVAILIAFFLVNQLWRKSRDLEAGRADAEHRAAHDALTGLPNRVSFEQALARTLTQRPSRDRRTTVLMLDLDRFKQVNDTLGHRAGDDLIRAVAQRLGQLIGPSDMLARLGGDEFAIIHHHPPGLTGPLELAQRSIDAIGKPFDIFGSEAFVGVSVGLAPVEAGEIDAHELTRKADIALYEAKASGRNRAVVFEESMNEFLQNRKTIEGELREALRRTDQLSIAFQPLFDAHRKIVGAEALSRWHHPHRGQVSPAHFIPVAEATGLIEQLGALVLQRACEMGAKWPGYTIAVNISPAQLRNPDFPSTVFGMLRETGMRPADLELEITEGILLEEVSDAAEALRIFRAAGIKIALDDFGTGYSSLNYLKRYPVDRIKIDRSFVSQLAPGNVSVAIVQAMVTLAHALKIEVTAEGVETEGQRSVLLDLGCNVYQGYLLSPPIAPPALEQLLSRPQIRVA
ncbi:MAG: EAL domain-containing protein [Hyphomicrobiales bacterium]|nr:MAG: EAL domain-containing protein [Hyphomicrobiales bacterium]